MSNITLSGMDLLSPENPVFRAYAFYSGILLLKVVLMSFLTAGQRFRKKAAVEDEVKDGPDSDVERVRRAHLNDIENIFPFFIAGLLYVLTGPNVYVAIWIFRIFALVRILHTLIYAIFNIPQPARLICFFIGAILTIFMIIMVLISFVII